VRPLNPWHLREWTPEEFGALLGRVFEEVEMYAQSPQGTVVTRLFDTAGRVWRRGAAILRQMVKLRRSIVPPRRGFYAVRPFDANADYEYLVARCRKPRAR
jgi:hypothetical protein